MEEKRWFIHLVSELYYEKLAYRIRSLGRITNKRKFSGYLQKEAHFGKNKWTFFRYSKKSPPILRFKFK